MRLSLWMLLCFAGWTLLVLIIGIGVRRWVSVLRGEADLMSFPADVPHGCASYRRAMRAHANCLESLPVFASLVLIGAVTGLNPQGMDALAATIMGARVAQTSVHMLFAESNLTIGVRFGFFFLQLAAMIAMGLLLAHAAMHA